MKEPAHPAPFSTAILCLVANRGLLPRGLILDPFAGVGRIHRLADAEHYTVGVEIEDVWEQHHPRTMRGNALQLPFRDGCFDGVFTSPVYGNRMSDSHTARDGSLRRSYTHDLRRATGDATRRLHPDNAGTMYAWQPAYWEFHERAWTEVRRVLKPGGRFLLNVSNCMRQKTEVPVVTHHAVLAGSLGFRFVGEHSVETPRMRYGENADERVPAEKLLVFERG